MIERLMDLERPYGGTEYRKLSNLSEELHQQLSQWLDQEGTRYLEQLEDSYMRRENAVLQDAFAEGFWTAVDLMLEFHQHRHS